MSDLVSWVLAILAVLGGLYMIGSVVLFAVLPKEETNDLYCCDDCEECK